MFGKILKRLMGSRNDRILRTLWKVVKQTNALEPTIQSLSDDQLRTKTQEFRQRLQQGETLNTILPEAFAVVREASQRTLGLRPFDVQLIGGMALHQGKIAEMRTGEGKTLVATLAAYLNALTGEGVHVVTVNDYLVKRDAEWMRPLYEFLGLTVAINLNGMTLAEKKLAYTADVVYGTNNEFGFDYLRDNMVFRLEDRVQRTLHYAIIDEVDSILIDEARTPLIISGHAEESSDLYIKINPLIPQLKLQRATEEEVEQGILTEEQRGDYMVDEKSRRVSLTEQGQERIEELLRVAGILAPGSSLYDISNINLMHYINAALRAHTLYQKDVHYVVKNSQIIIVDEHTGRLMEGRRWSEGLHQAVEAKEGVPVQLENQTLATITLQNYFRMYEKLSGMTGTADTEAFEFQKIYGLEVVVIPTNRPMIRKDLGDQVYLTEKVKFNAILAAIRACQERQQPVLVGTASIENSERLSQLLKKEKIPHQVLNAKQHEREAKVIAEAGRPGAVTIATNMAGRGTDIVLGGNLAAELAELGDVSSDEIAKHRKEWHSRHELVLKAGGLHVLGTERHESRRIDNQLRGRSGRQGDPGSSQFYLSMEDNLLRIFAAERMTNLLRRFGVQEEEVIEHPMITKAIERAQRRVESFNFDIRKQLLEYDDVANDQRRVIYQQRLELLKADDIGDTIFALREEAVNDKTGEFIPPHSLEEEWDLEGLEQCVTQDFGVKLPLKSWLEQEPELYEEPLKERILAAITESYQNKIANVSPEIIKQVEKSVMLQVLDTHWKDHLAIMDQLRQGIHLRGYAQKNPAQEYKRESFDLFAGMLNQIKYEVVATLNRVELVSAAPIAVEQQRQQNIPMDLTFEHAEMGGLSSPESTGTQAFANSSTQPFVRETPKIGRNDPCYCGSGKKYKQCHGKLD